MNIEDMTIGQAQQLAAMFGGKPSGGSAYQIGGQYMFRTVTHIVTGRLVSIHHDGLVVTEAAWIADTGRYSQAVATGNFNEVEPYPKGAMVVVNMSAMIDAVQIPVLPTAQK